MAETDTIRIARGEHRVAVTLDRPEQRNAITPRMPERLHAALQDVARGAAGTADPRADHVTTLLHASFVDVEGARHGGLAATEDVSEAFLASVQKRKPLFRGR